MPAAMPPAPRKTLLDWIDLDDGDTSDFAPPACSASLAELHGRVVLSPGDGIAAEPLPPPPGLRLAPLG